MIIISEEQVKRLLSVQQAIEVVEQAFKDYADGLITIGNRGTLEVNNDRGDACLFLPAQHPTTGCGYLSFRSI